jgi:hypothetical protein
VTGGISDREKYWLLLAASLREGLVSPGVPVDRVVLVLEQVGAGLGGEPVGHGVEDNAGAALGFQLSAISRNSEGF